MGREGRGTADERFKKAFFIILKPSAWSEKYCRVNNLNKSGGWAVHHRKGLIKKQAEILTATYKYSVQTLFYGLHSATVQFSCCISMDLAYFKAEWRLKLPSNWHCRNPIFSIGHTPLASPSERTAKSERRLERRLCEGEWGGEGQRETVGGEGQRLHCLAQWTS